MCSVSLHSYVLCFLVVLVKLSVYLPSDWLERLLRKPIRGKEKPRPKSIYDFFGLVYLSPALQDISDISRITVARYSLFVLRVPLNASQPTNTAAMRPTKASPYFWDKGGFRGPCPPKMPNIVQHDTGTTQCWCALQ